MKYCSSCGHQVERQTVPHEPKPRFVCGSCRTIHYSNPKVLVACIAYLDNRILMCRRAQSPSRGLWTVPAGFMEEGETIEEAAARETEEETGVKIAIDRLDLYAILSLPEMNEVYVTLKAELTDLPVLKAGAESLEVAMVAENELAPHDWAFSGAMVRDTAAALYREIRDRRFGIHKIRMGINLAAPYETRSYVIADSEALAGTRVGSKAV